MNSTFEKELEKRGYLVYHNVGVSMMPLIKQGRDVMVIEVPKRSVKKYDAVLYKRDNGQYILHRIVGENADGFVLRGDNQYEKEYGIKNEQILGLLTAVIRNGKELKTDSFPIKIYAFLRCDFFFVRKLIFKVKNFLKDKRKA